MTEPEEWQLVQQAQHDPQAFSSLYERYVDRIYSYVYRQTHNTSLAEDVTSVTFEQALRHLHTYKWRGHSFGAWLYRIARNELLQQYRRERFVQHADPSGAEQGQYDQHIEVLGEYDELYHALKQLSKSDQEILSLRFFEDLSNSEAAHVLNCTTASVYLRTHRALHRLRKKLSVVIPQGVLNVSE